MPYRVTEKTLRQALTEKVEIEVVTRGAVADEVHRGLVEVVNLSNKRVNMRLKQGAISIPIGSIIEVNHP